MLAQPIFHTLQVYPTIHLEGIQFGYRDANESAKKLGTIKVNKVLCSPFANIFLSPSLLHTQEEFAHGKEIHVWLFPVLLLFMCLEVTSRRTSAAVCSVTKLRSVSLCFPDVSQCLRAQ